MKAMILAAGRGERLRPLTDTLPKPLVKVAEQSLIEYHLYSLAKAGITEVIINCSWLAEKIMATLGDGSRYGLTIEYSLEAGSPLETAGGIIQVLDKFSNEAFIVVNGDIWTDYDFSTLPKDFSGLAHLVLVDNPEHNTKGDFALDSGKHTNKLSTSGNLLTFSGIAVYKPELFTKLSKGIRPLGPLLRDAIEQQQVTGEYYSGAWFDVGTLQRLTEINNWLEQHK